MRTTKRYTFLKEHLEISLLGKNEFSGKPDFKIGFEIDVYDIQVSLGLIEIAFWWKPL